MKGDNPLSLVRLEELGVYICASTDEILQKALKRCRLHRLKQTRIELRNGDILKIDSTGKAEKGLFNPVSFTTWDTFNWFPTKRCKPIQSLSLPDADYDALLELGLICGVTEEEIEMLLDQGYSETEIEELLENPNLFREHRDEISDADSCDWWEV